MSSRLFTHPAPVSLTRGPFIARLFQRRAAVAVPPATGLMVFARRESLITNLLSGLSHQDTGIQVEAVKHVLLAYLQTKGQDLAQAQEAVLEMTAPALNNLTAAMVKLANEYNWE